MSAEPQEVRQKRRKEERPDEILAAALTVFSKDGFAAARLDEIADRAGCTKGTIYVYFDSKEDLFKAVVRKLLVPQFRKVDHVLRDESLDTATRIKLFVRGAYREIVDGTSHTAMMRLLIADGPKFPELVEFYHAEIGRVGYELMQKTLEQGVARGEIRPIATDLVPEVIFGPIIAATVRRLLRGDLVRPVDIAQLIEVHLDILLRGLLVDPTKA
ncbi:MAG: TetR/AcrR family transcriptional regulator [Alphaproteobacteria bacterium]|jgi:AcrR family transcriptional regulator|nr:TetR/AcrR family transcriptional regulator [Alphaproteobacteria bacterium]